MQYCRETTLTHSRAVQYSVIVEDINQLLTEEGCDAVLPLFNNSEVVLNLDKLEEVYSTSIGRIEKNKSMDMAFGIVDPNNTLKKQMLLVELKFNMISCYSLNKKSMEEKVSRSCDLLSDSIPICNQYIFVFKTNHIHEAISRMYRFIPKIDPKFVAYDIISLKAKFF